MSDANAGERVRSEPRTIRPFFKLGTIEGLLDDAALGLSPHEPPQKERFLERPPAGWSDLEPRIATKLSAEREKLPQALARAELELTVVGFSRVPKHNRLSCRLPLREDEDDIELDADAVRALPASGRAEIRLALCLAADWPDADRGLPHRKGQWISSKTFAIGRPPERDLFPL